MPTQLDVTLVFFDGCPNWRTADARLREALAQIGRTDVAIVHQDVATAEEAEALQFRGSPTVLVGGRDPFPDGETPVGLSCRVYRTADGLAGSPTVDQLVAVLR